jgi:hypothetical protein
MEWNSENKIKELVLTGTNPAKHKLSSSRGAVSFQESVSDSEIIKFTVSTKSIVEHDEHDKLILSKGTYYKVNQMELDPFTNTMAYVFD